jgi:triphosphoribosyl-dephospho-CoA synthase
MSPGLLAQVACILEVTARKPGNVHRFADFAGDAHFLDFLLSAAAIAGPMDRASEIGVGRAVLEAVEATRRVVATNTNLGMVLLIAPLACVPEGVPLRTGVVDVLTALTVDDARAVYRAIRLARPGGLGEVDDQDIAAEPTVTLLDAMRLAADRDLVARQYATAYEDLFDLALPALGEGFSDPLPPCGGGLGWGVRISERTPPTPSPCDSSTQHADAPPDSTPHPNPPPQRGEGNRNSPDLEHRAGLETAIIRAYLVTLAARPDTLIARKRGPAVAAEASRRAALALTTGDLGDLDSWLRDDGHARNPGATADLIAAALFAALQDGTIALPRPDGARGWPAGSH